MTAVVAPEEVRSEAVQLFGRRDGASAAFDIEVERYASHARVQYWIDYFSTRARRHFEVYLQRAGRYDSMIRTRLAASGLPQDMIFLAMIESGFNQSARSHASAVGLWQFIAPTARRYGLTVDAWVDERRDPGPATDAAIRMITELNDRFGSLYLAAAGYNAGPGKIRAGLARYDFGALNGDDVFFALAERPFLRRETRDYVPKLIAAAIISKNPERWGFNTRDNLWRPLRFDSLVVDFAVGLDVIARLAETTRAVIEEMNPQFVRGVTPPDREVWVRVPEGMKDAVTARLDQLPPGQRITVITHHVSRGETLSRIARQYGVTVEDLRLANRLRTTRLRIGQRLVVPTAMLRERAPAAARPTASRSRTAAPARPTRASTSGTARRMHVVRQGESAWSISQQFGVSLPALLAANGLSRRSLIRPGQTLRIP
ncbi:MAG: hypothetical protein A2085_09255 [Gemmatimonadetes bacterium GWC2_71_10]|nr:MAG: hypothetical protein A2085_09255 [Gemmatimonadetes bacterium GWC2_71_10]